MPYRLTRNYITQEPCQVVVEDPTPKGKQAPEVALEGAQAGLELGNVFGRRGLSLDICSCQQRPAKKKDQLTCFDR